MISRTDQMHSYQFMVRRILSALVLRETDPMQSPLRRGVGALFASVMLLVIGAAGFGAYGAITGMNGKGWRTEGAVVVEKETGASYVYIAGVLHPTLNYTSALLASDATQPQVFRVARGELVGVRRGQALGIAGAPDSVSAAADLVHTAWSMCAAPRNSDGSSAVATVYVGSQPSGTRRLGDAGVLAREADDGSVHLLWHGSDHLVQNPRTLIPAVFGAQQVPFTVTAAWLDTLDRGADLAPLPVSGQGDATRVIPGGHRVGDIVYASTGGGRQYYLLGGDGVTPITTLQALIQLTGTGPAQQVAANQIAAAPQQQAPTSGQSAPPRNPPRLAVPPDNASATVCGVLTDWRKPLVLAMGAAVADVLDDGVATGAAGADRVAVPAGRDALVVAMTAPTARSGQWNLVADTGLRYPVPAASLTALGYQASDAVRVPVELLDTVAAGPTLSATAARRTAPTPSVHQ